MILIVQAKKKKEMTIDIIMREKIDIKMTKSNSSKMEYKAKLLDNHQEMKRERRRDLRTKVNNQLSRIQTR